MNDKRLNLVVDLINKTEAGFKKIYADLDESARRTENMTRAMRAAGLAGGVAFAGLSLATKKFLDDAGQLEQAEIAFETMLGSGEKAKKMLEDLSDFASKTPFELQGIRATAKQLLAMSIPAEDMIPTMKALGDVSAGLGVDLDRLAYNYGQVKTQTKLTGVEMKDFMRAGVPIISTLSEILGKSEADIQEMVSAGQIGFPIVEEAFRRMTSEGGQFANLMEKQSSSLKGQISNLNDNLTRMSETIGTALIPVAKEVTGYLLKITQSIAAWAQKNPELAKTILVSALAATALLTALGLIGLVVPTIITGVNLMSKAYAGLRTVMLLNISVSGIYAATTGAISAAFTWARTSAFLFAASLNTVRGAMLATGIGAIIVLIGVLAYKINEIAGLVGGFGNAFKLVWQAIKITVADSIASIIEWFGKMIDLIPGIDSTFKDTVENLRAGVGEMQTEMDNTALAMVETANAATTASTEIVDANANTGKSFELLTDNSEEQKKAAEAYFKSLVDSVTSIRDEIKKAYDEIAQSTLDFQKSVGEEQVSYEEDVAMRVAEAYTKTEDLKKELKAANKKEDNKDEVQKIKDQIKEQEGIITSYKDLKINLDNSIDINRKYLRMNEIQQMTADHEKKLLMLQKEYLETQVASLQKIALLNTEHATIMGLMDTETAAKLNAEILKGKAFRDRLALEKQGLTTWVAESELTYRNYVQSVNSILSQIKSVGGGTSSSSKSSNLPGRASGGSVQPGRSFIVGEKGPELFTPETYGRIAANGTGGGGVTLVFTGNTFLDQDYADKIQQRIMDDLMRAMKVPI